jgi:hypothetical protein
MLNSLISSNSNIFNQLVQFTKASESSSQHQTIENSALAIINKNIKSIEGTVKEESGTLLTKLGQLLESMGSTRDKVRDHLTICNLPVILTYCKPKPTVLRSIISLAANITVMPKIQMHDSSHIQELRLKDEMILKLKSSLTKLISALKPKGDGLLQASKDIMLTIQKFK